MERKLELLVRNGYDIQIQHPRITIKPLKCLRRNLPFRKLLLPLIMVVAISVCVGLWLKRYVRSFAMAGNGDGPQPERQRKHSL